MLTFCGCPSPPPPPAPSPCVLCCLRRRADRLRVVLLHGQCWSPGAGRAGSKYPRHADEGANSSTQRWATCRAVLEPRVCGCPERAAGWRWGSGLTQGPHRQASRVAPASWKCRHTHTPAPFPGGKILTPRAELPPFPQRLGSDPGNCLPTNGACLLSLSTADGRLLRPRARVRAHERLRARGRCLQRAPAKGRLPQQSDAGPLPSPALCLLLLLLPVLGFRGAGGCLRAISGNRPARGQENCTASWATGGHAQGKPVAFSQPRDLLSSFSSETPENACWAGGCGGPSALLGTPPSSFPVSSHCSSGCGAQDAPAHTQSAQGHRDT